MTKELDSLGALAQVFIADNLKMIAAAETAMGRAARVVQENAKDRIGDYQKATGPFPEWDPLADSTEAEKARLGYPADAPLLRSGVTRDSIVTEHSGNEAIIGSKEEALAYSEFGTPTEPPRPVLGPAAYDSREKIHKIIGDAAVGALIGNAPVHPSLGYDMDIKS